MSLFRQMWVQVRGEVHQENTEEQGTGGEPEVGSEVGRILYL